MATDRLRIPARCALRAADGTADDVGGLLVPIAAVVVGAAVLAVVVRLVVAQMFFIPSASMTPTLRVGDRIIVDKLAYEWSAPHRGDIVVFHRPPGVDPRDAFLVKRIIGLPGDVIGTHDGRVTIDGRPIAEPWLPTPAPPTLPLPGRNLYGLATPVRVPAGEYFVLGDDRTDSEDSRYFGPIPRSAIVGRMAFKVWSLDHAAGVGALVVLVATALICLILALRRRPVAAGEARAPPTA